MARVNTYNTDTDVSGNDKVLGSDISGATKNYTLDSIGEYFTRGSVVKVGGQIAYRFQTVISDFTRGQFMLTASNSSAINLSAVTSIYVHKEILNGDDATTYLNRLFSNKFELHSAKEVNTYAVYNVISIADDGVGILVTVSVDNSNGALANEEDYVLSFAEEDKSFTHTQGVASATWAITHNLNKKPSVTVVDSADNVVVGDIEYNDNNSVTITFSGAFSGKAYLN
jgi:hypothetical protein